MIAGGDDADLPYCFFAPTEGAREVRLDQCRRGAQVDEYPLRQSESLMQQQRAVLCNGQGVDVRKELCLGLLAEAFDLADSPSLTSGFEIRDAFDLQRAVKRADFFETQSRDGAAP